MLRLSKEDEGKCTILILEGQLCGPSIDAVETSCNQALTTGKPVQLFLRDVTEVDDAGRDLLARLASKGIRLRASGVYISYLVRSLMGERNKTERVT